MKEEKETRIFNWTNGINDEELQEVKKVIENEKILLDGLSDAELCLLRRFLEQITANIDKIPGGTGRTNKENIENREKEGKNH